MGKQHKIFPPLEERRTVVKRRIFRLFINLFVLLGAGVLYYVVFSFFFDTPQEYSMRKSTEAMRREYEALSKRLEEVEAVLDNVEERDRNVFGILFESEPYVLDEYASSRWNRMERLLSMSNSSLGAHLLEHTALLEEGLDNLSRSFDSIRGNASALDGAADAIPAIQPVINNDLTLLTASFGMRIHPFYKSLTQHKGVDFTLTFPRLCHGRRYGHGGYPTELLYGTDRNDRPRQRLSNPLRTPQQDIGQKGTESKPGRHHRPFGQLRTLARPAPPLRSHLQRPAC